MPSERAQENAWFRDKDKLPPPPKASAPRPPARPQHENRRKHPRFEVDGASVSLCRNGFLTALGLGKSNKGREALDLSEGGARVLLTEGLEPGTKVRIRIEMERYKDAIEIGGEVRWCYQRPKSADYCAGVMFVGEDPTLSRKISLMREWFTSPQYLALRESRRGQRDSGFTFPK